MKRSIILFPKFDNLNIIENIRAKYDPLATCIAPHITLVFPFESDLSTEDLKMHFKRQIKGIKKFSLQLWGITGDFRAGYLFLNVKKGNDAVIELHDRLYQDVLANFLFKKVTYSPHLTVGRLSQESAFNHALDELSACNDRFETMIDKVYIETIDASENSKIEFVFELE